MHGKIAFTNDGSTQYKTLIFQTNKSFTQSFTIHKLLNSCLTLALDAGIDKLYSDRQYISSSLLAVHLFYGCREFPAWVNVNDV